MAHIPRLYLPGRLGPGPLTLEGDAARRLSSVMRMRKGDPFLVFAGDGREWQATVTEVVRDRLHAQVGEAIRVEAAPPLVVEVWCGLIRANRFDWAVEKCTEAGADVIRPLVSEHAARGEQVSGNRAERLERIAVEAAEQSGRLFVPVVGKTATFAQLLEQAAMGPLVIFDREGATWQEVAALIPPMGRVTVGVGPEGGFSAEEVAATKARGALVASLGPNILRTETAAVAAVVAIRGM